MRIIILFFIFIPTFLKAECNFKSANYIDQLSNPSSIKNIKIEIPKSSKYITNFWKIILTNSHNIPPKLKRKFEAKIFIEYDFGSCHFKGRVRQLGDWRDHIGFTDKGEPIRSLHIKLIDGNILNNVRFKLFLPESRNDLNEVFGSVLLKNLGFLTPETFQVETIVNGVKFKMLFQEEINKELLEKNNRREGPLFEGDESILWSYKDYINFKLIQLALSRLRNPNWFLKGDSSQFITLEAYEKLQEAYLDYSQNFYPGLYTYAIFPNSKKDTIFEDYYFINYAMSGEHGLSPHNRQFYYNVFLRSFEPIYYDGNFDLFKRFNKENIYMLSFVFQKGYKFPYLNFLKDETFKKKIYTDFNLRTINKVNSKKFFDKAILKLSENITEIQQHIDKIDKQIKIDSNISKNIKSFYENQKEWKLEQKNIFLSKKLENAYEIIDEKGTIYKLSNKELARVIARNKFQKKRFVYLPQRKNILKYESNFDQKFIKEFNGVLIKSKESSYSIDGNKKILSFEQSKNSDWFLILNANLAGWKLIFNGIKNNELESDSVQRFNKYGLTGCLNIYNSYLDETSILANNGSCEDSINIISSRGNLNEIAINNSFADAIDFDFSNIKIQKIFVNKAGNDCIDLSAGNYELNEANLKNCNDKAISVGEKSNLNLNNVLIDKSFIGISSKDLSLTKINQAKIFNSKLCAEAKQKKQEFGGGKLIFKSVDCTGEFSEDNKSIIVR